MVTSREIGTLVVVILKARNLPNKRHIGKQDPFCTVGLNGEKRRTKAIRRGGQHPEWDEEVRFTLFEDPDAEPAPLVNGDGTPPPPPPKSNGKEPPKIKGGRSMALACYADDPREPDLIGETNVDLTEALTKGETDEWFTLMNKEKYCGEVYLELTFWSNEPEPEKKSASKPKAQKQYGGPGSFVPAGEYTSSSDVDVQFAITRHPSTGNMREDLRRDNIPPALRASHSLAQLDLYVPPYETSRSRHSAMDVMVNDYAEMGVVDHVNRRQSFPPQHAGYLPRPSSSIGFQDPQGLSSQSTNGFHQNNYSEGGASYMYGSDVSVHSTGSLPYHQSTMSANPETYQPPYESTLPSSSYAAPVRHNGPRHSIAAAPSGFMSMPTPSPSGFVPLSSHPSQPSGFAPLPAPTPAPGGYGPQSTIIPSSSFSTLPQPPIAPSGFGKSGPLPSGVYHQSVPQQPPPQSAYAYQQQYVPPPPPQSQPPSQPPPSASAPPNSQPSQQPYAVPPPPSSVPPQSHSAPPDQYQHGATPSLSHEPIPPPPPLSESPSSGQPSASRPLPQPTQSYGQPSRRRQSSLPVPPPGGPPGMYNPPSRGPSGALSPPIGGSAGQYNTTQGALPAGYSVPSNTSLRASSGSYNPVTGQVGAYNPPIGAPAGSYNPPQGQPGPYDHPASHQIGNTYSTIPPPPPLPRRSVSPAPLGYPPNGQAPAHGTSPSLPPPSQYHTPGFPNNSPSLPPPPQNLSRRPSLPPTPTMGYPNQPQSAYQALPPPPPPPSMPPNVHYEPISTFPSSSQSQMFHPGPPPRPPAQPNPQQQYMSSPVNQQYGGCSPIAERGW